jgi:hypothetical protein
LLHVEPVANNADLYEMPLPEYTHLATEGELSVDAETTRDEKTGFGDRSPAYDAPQHTTPVQQRLSNPYSLSGRDHEHGGESSIPPTRSMAVHPPGHYLTEPLTTANLAGVRECSILRDRPAVWLVKRKSMALSPLAAAVLTQEGLIGVKDLQLYARLLPVHC